MEKINTAFLDKDDNLKFNKEVSIDFHKTLLSLMKICAENDTDNMDISFDAGNYRVKAHITFSNPERICDE